MTLRKPIPTPERVLLFITIVLCLVGLLFVFEASVAEAFTTFSDQFFFFREQIQGLIIGLISLTIIRYIPTAFWKKISPVLYGVSIVLLASVFLPGIGREVNGAHRWLYLPGFSFQPVEIVKFALLVFFATWMEKHQKLGPFLFLTALPALILFRQPDLGSALIVLALAFGMYYLAGAKIKTLVGIGSLGIVVISALILMQPYRLNRVQTFLNPESDRLGTSFHIHQITLALGNGGWFGQGIGKSRQKFSYIPEVSTDSIFSIIAEELGFVGSIGLLMLFLVYLHAGFSIVKKTEAGSFHHLLAAGVLVWIGMQMVLNLSAVVALVPLTGVPLPFISYGKTSLVMLLSATGILLAVNRETRLKENA